MSDKVQIDLLNYEMVAFDFDGVILDSNGFKSDLFIQILTKHGFTQDQCTKFSAYQRANFGISRYRLFSAVCEGQFGPAESVTTEQLLMEFGEQSKALYRMQRETHGMRQALLRARKGERSLYIVSGTDQSELRLVASELDLATNFAGIYGSPANKIDNLGAAKSDHFARTGTPVSRMLFLGDAMADMEAAEAVGADFVFVASYSADRDRMEREAIERRWPVIEDLRQLI